jgi:hypothetical protein
VVANVLNAGKTATKRMKQREGQPLQAFQFTRYGGV